ncbi:thymidylate synthase [bacterium]|nr:thymidylate synthase [bacterium]MDB9847585.1 thymidylate synthase [bacterium]
MNKLDEQYRGILAELLYNGREKGDRTGTGTLSKFGMQIRHNMKDGFPLLTTKKMAVKTMMTELKWFLKGDTNIKYLVDNNCNIWNGDAYKKYHQAFPETEMLSQEQFITLIKTNDDFAKKWGDLGPIYGKQWRRWENESEYIDGVSYMMYNAKDQISDLLDQLKTNPNSRRLMVSTWNVGELDQMTLPPCHYGFQCYVVDGKLSLMWSQRSVDTFLGLPFNIASYGMLLMLLCEETGYEPGDLIGNLGDTHLYNNHIEQAKEQVSRDGFDLPTIKLSNVDILNGEFDYELINYTSATAIKAPISN